MKNINGFIKILDLFNLIINIIFNMEYMRL